MNSEKITSFLGGLLLGGVLIGGTIRYMNIPNAIETEVQFDVQSVELERPGDMINHKG